MAIEVYADVIFIINLIMDSFILWIVSRFVHQKIKRSRLVLGGLVMALLYCCVMFTAAFGFMNQIVASVLILSMGIAITFRPTGIRPFIKMLLTAYCVSFTVGGLGMVLFYLTDLPYAAYALTSQPNTNSALSWKLPAICILGSYLLIKLGLRAVERITLKRQVLCPVHIFFDGQDVRFNALVDTGHTLHEPISQAPVIVAEFESVKPFLPDSLKILFYENKENDLSLLISGQPLSPFYNRVRMIPFTSLGRSSGMLIGFKPDKVNVSISRNELTRDDVVIGIYNRKLTCDNRYQGLIGPEIMAI